jgi:hypothetical protein
MFILLSADIYIVKNKLNNINNIKEWFIVRLPEALHFLFFESFSSSLLFGWPMISLAFFTLFAPCLLYVVQITVLIECRTRYNTKISINYKRRITYPKFQSLWTGTRLRSVVPAVTELDYFARQYMN